MENNFVFFLSNLIVVVRQFMDVQVRDPGTGEVIGARVQAASGGAFRSVRARRGVVFATGGYSRDQGLLDEHFGRGVIKGTCRLATTTPPLPP